MSLKRHFEELAGKRMAETPLFDPMKLEARLDRLERFLGLVMEMVVLDRWEQLAGEASEKGLDENGSTKTPSRE